MDNSATNKMVSKKMTETGSVINLEEADDVEFAKGDNEQKLMLEDKDRRGSDPGILPSPMANASFFSKYISFW